MSIKATQPEDSAAAAKRVQAWVDEYATRRGLHRDWIQMLGLGNGELVLTVSDLRTILAALATPSPKPAEAKTAAVDGMTDAIQWPKTRDVGRMGDMTPVRQSVLRIGLDSDNDVYVNLWDSGPNGWNEEYQSVSIEFCNGGGGGGKSPRTRAALINLMSAIEADNAADSSRAWPFKRAAIATQEGGHD